MERIEEIQTIIYLGLDDMFGKDYPYLKAGDFQEIANKIHKVELQPVNKTEEWLVSEILSIIQSKQWQSLYHMRMMLDKSDFESVAREIASILPSQSEELESLKVHNQALQKLLDERLEMYHKAMADLVSKEEMFEFAEWYYVHWTIQPIVKDYETYKARMK